MSISKFIGEANLNWCRIYLKIFYLSKGRYYEWVGCKRWPHYGISLFNSEFQNLGGGSDSIIVEIRLMWIGLLLGGVWENHLGNLERDQFWNIWSSKLKYLKESSLKLISTGPTWRVDVWLQIWKRKKKTQNVILFSWYILFSFW